MSRPPRPDADHRIRESWRRAQFAKFLDQGRHELEGIPVRTYCEQTAKRTSAAFRQPVEHFRGILTGAACSLAMQRAMRQQGVGSCCWCSSGAVPCWHHLAWQCPHFLPSRPPPLRPVSCSAASDGFSATMRHTALPCFAALPLSDRQCLIGFMLPSRRSLALGFATCRPVRAHGCCFFAVQCIVFASSLSGVCETVLVACDAPHP